MAEIPCSLGKKEVEEDGDRRAERGHAEEIQVL